MVKNIDFNQCSQGFCDFAFSDSSFAKHGNFVQYPRGFCEQFLEMKTPNVDNGFMSTIFSAGTRVDF
ncbi:MAG: hypothetical protein ABSB84_04050 [Verrucomicrobiota bacterium]|jgi:hypothetical protein